VIVGQPNFDHAFRVGPFKFGLVLTALVNFVLRAAVIYAFIVAPTRKLLASLQNKPTALAAPTAQEKLLTEIRDLLQRRTA